MVSENLFFEVSYIKAFVSWNCSVLNISEIRIKVSMGMSPTQRPRGVLGFWSSLMTALGNTENMPVSLVLFVHVIL